MAATSITNTDTAYITLTINVSSMVTQTWMIKKAYITTMVQNNNVLLYWHSYENIKSTYIKTILYTDVTSPAATSATDLKSKIDAFIKNTTSFAPSAIRKPTVITGAIDGTNMTFTLANAPLFAGDEEIFLSGRLLKPTTDYSISGGGLGTTLTLTFAPAVGDYFQCTTTQGGALPVTVTLGYIHLAASATIDPALKTVFGIDSSAAPVTLTFPPSTGFQEAVEYTVQDEGNLAATNNITLQLNGGDLWGATGSGVMVMSVNGECVIFYTDKAGKFYIKN